jgi:3-deoxy-D-manno-octulosonate 8-phosphate phosphatase (KDO 8-P phosphatase)
MLAANEVECRRAAGDRGTDVERVQVQAMILDVDGVLTDGRLYFSASGEALKVFHVHDGTAIKDWRQAGRRVALLSGRPCPIVEVRARELGVEEVVLGAEDKLQAFRGLLQAWGMDGGAACYVGDDHPDLAPMAECGFPVAVANAVDAVKRRARYVTRTPGGHGAVREVVDYLLNRSSR